MKWRAEALRTWSANMAIGFDALRIHPLRTVLSVLGIIIGSASLVATLSVSDGMVRFAREQVQKQTSVQVIVLASRTSRFREGAWEPVRDYPVFTERDAAQLFAAIPGAAAVTMSLGGRTTVSLHRREHTASATLGTAALPAFTTLDIGAGRFFTDIESSRGAPVVVLNYALARELAPGREPLDMVGQDVHVRGRLHRVIGVLARGEFEDDENPSFALYAPIARAAVILDPPGAGRFTPSIQVLAPTVESVTPIRDAAIEWVAARYAHWEDRVRVIVGLENLAQVEQALLLVKLFLAALVGISLVVGGVGIMNVLLASVVERTREIGIRKSVGARSADIQAQFLAESVAIALAGAGIGLLLGYGAAVVLTAVFRHVTHAPVFAVLSPGSVAIAALSSSLVGLAFGTYPARRAAAFSPIVAMAQE